MKKIVLLLVVLLFGAGSTVTQQDKSAEKVAKQAEKGAERAKEAVKKTAEEAEANTLFEQAVQALKSKDFVLEADHIEFKRGSFVYVTPSTSSVSVRDERATIQSAFSTSAAGPNGVRGTTADRTASGIQIETGKRGSVMCETNVQDVAISIRVTFRMAKGMDKRAATVLPNFNSNRISLTGDLYSSSESNASEGHST